MLSILEWLVTISSVMAPTLALQNCTVLTLQSFRGCTTNYRRPSVTDVGKAYYEE
jgi:hypothetical protein